MELSRDLPDEELLANLRSGRLMDETIKSIYRQHFPSLSWWVMNNNGTRQDAEDVFQDVVVNFIDVVQKGKFRGESSVKTFLFSLNRFTWLNELKKRNRSLAREEKYEREMDRAVINIDMELVSRESNEQLVKVLDALGDSCKKILLLFYYESLPMKEIVEFLHYENEQVVRNKKYKCLKQLEKMLAENPGLRNILKNMLHE